MAVVARGPLQMPDSGGVSRNVAVVVVHGVGDTRPGDTVNYIVDSLGGTTEPVAHNRQDPVPEPEPGAPSTVHIVAAAAHNEVHYLPEPATDLVEAERTEAAAKAVKLGRTPSAAMRFPVFARRVTPAGGGRATVIELYWADLTKKDGGWFNAAVGFARFIFEIPHVIDGFLRHPKDWLSQVFRWLVLVASCCVRGPLAGYCTVMLGGGLIYWSFSQIPKREDVGMLADQIAKVIGDVAQQMPPWLNISTILRPMAGMAETPYRDVLLICTVGIAAFAVTSACVSLLARSERPAVTSSALCLLILALFYLIDILVLRPGRYANYAGILYFDYLSVAMFVLGWAGFHAFVTRRKHDVGFADLGFFVGAWAWFFVFDLSPLGDGVRTGLGFDVEQLIKPSDIHSSTVHFKAFDLYYWLLSWLWASWAVLMLSAFVLAVALYVLNFWRWSRGYRGIFAALALATVQACVWLTVLPALGVLHIDDVLCSGNRYSDKIEPVGCQSKLRQNNDLVRLLSSLQEVDAPRGVLPAQTRAKLDRTIAERTAQKMHPPMLRAITELSLSVVWHSAILLGAVVLGLAVVFWHFLRTRILPLSSTLRPPRLVISMWGLWWLGVLGFINVVLCFSWIDHGGETARLVLARIGLEQAASMGGIAVPAEVVQMVVLFASALLIVSQASVFKTAFSGILDVMQDLIDHHYRVGTSLVGRMTRRPGDQPIRRDRITARLDVVMRELVAKQDYDDVIFLAHSQGTVIVFDYLRGDRARAALGDRRPHVVTAGSPLSNIYEYYFNEYRDLPAQIAAMSPCPATWTNFYRLDDPISGPLSTCVKIEAKPVDGPVCPVNNVRLQTGAGHFAYWPDGEVRERIAGLLNRAYDRATV